MKIEQIVDINFEEPKKQNFSIKTFSESSGKNEQFEN